MTSERIPVRVLPALRVIKGGWQRDEVQVEAISFAQEVNRDANEIHRAEMGMAVPNARVLFLSGRLAGRSERIQHELRALTDPDPSAA